MRRFRNWRRRSAALALAPVTAAILIGILTGIGPASAAGTGGASLDANHHLVSPNERVTLHGYFRAPATTAAPDGTDKPTAPGYSQAVRIQFRASGAANWQDTERTKTGRSGKFSERALVTRSGHFRAAAADGRTTKPEKVRVKSETQARISEQSPTVGEKVAIRGHVTPAGSHRRVAVRVGGETLRTRTGQNGRFAVKWKADAAGEVTVRVRAGSDRIAAGSAAKAGKLTVFRPAVASYYGPGLYGGALACGGTLSPSTVGVANKTLPCGTKLTVRYGSREVETKVIDRGPYVAGREFDLTAALKSKLGFGSTGTVLVSR